MRIDLESVDQPDGRYFRAQYIPESGAHVFGLWMRSEAGAIRSFLYALSCAVGDKKLDPMTLVTAGVHHEKPPVDFPP